MPAAEGNPMTTRRRFLASLAALVPAAWLARRTQASPPKCPKCNGGGWVCEGHPDKAWPDGCQCGPGMPCQCELEAWATRERCESLARAALSGPVVGKPITTTLPRD